jgi:hypothetical protein
MYENLPSWLNLLVLLGLAIITRWYAYSTREMARIMKETYETETAPQLACTVKDLATKISKKGKKKISFTLVVENAGKYLLTIHTVAILADIKRHGDFSDIALSQAVPLAPNKDHSLPCETIVPGLSANLRVRIDYQDFKGRSHSKELSIL